MRDRENPLRPPASRRWWDPGQKNSWSNADDTPIGGIMTLDTVCVGRSLPVEELRALLMGESIGGVPVIDDEGRAVGVVTKTDLLRQDVGPGATVGDIMTPVTFTLTEDASVSRAAALMAFERVHRVPVVDAGGRVVGIVSALDVLRWLGREDGYVVSKAGPASRL